MARKRRKGLRRGNLRARKRRPINSRVNMGNGRGGAGYSMPVSSGTSVTAQAQRAGRRPGTGRPGIGWWLPPEGPPYPI